MHIEAALPSTVVHVPALIILVLRANHNPDSRKNRKGKKASGHMRSADNCVASMISNGGYKNDDYRRIHCTVMKT